MDSYASTTIKIVGFAFAFCLLFADIANAAEDKLALNSEGALTNTMPSWVDEGSLNIYPNQFVYVVSTRHAQSASLDSFGDNVLVAWSELNVKGVPLLYAKHRKDGSWIQLGKPLNINETSAVFYPTSAVNGEKKLISWIESDIKNKPQVYVKEWNGTKWVLLGGSVNVNRSKKAISTSLAIFKNEPVVTWVEEGEKYDLLRVKIFNGENWRVIGEKLNADTFPIDIVVKSDGNHLYVVWSEVADNGVMQVRVVKGDGREWENVGDIVNSHSDRHTFSPTLTFNNDQPVVAVSEIAKSNVIMVRVKKFDGTGWVDIGSVLNINKEMHATSPTVASYNNILYAGFSEKNSGNHSNVYVKSFFNGQWSFVGDMLNINNNAIAVSPAISVGSDLIAVWSEPNRNGVFQIHVKRLENEAGR